MSSVFDRYKKNAKPNVKRFLDHSFSFHNRVFTLLETKEWDLNQFAQALDWSIEEVEEVLSSPNNNVDLMTISKFEAVLEADIIKIQTETESKIEITIKRTDQLDKNVIANKRDFKKYILDRDKTCKNTLIK